jgi:GTP-binding protein HflX
VVGRPTVVALNKIDKLPQSRLNAGCWDEFPDSVLVSAATGAGLETLLERVEEILAADLVYLTVQVPYDRGDLAALFHEQGTVVQTLHNGSGTVIEGYLPRRWLGHFRAHLI